MEKEETKSHDPAKSFDYHKKTALEKLEKLKATMEKAQKELDFDPKEKGWDQARAMRKVSDEVGKFNQKLSEIGRKDYFFDRKEYGEHIKKEGEAFKKDIGYKDMDDKGKEVVDTQIQIMSRTNPANFRRVRGTASKILGEHNKDVGEKFTNSFTLPPIKAIVKEESKSKSKDGGMSK